MRHHIIHREKVERVKLQVGEPKVSSVLSAPLCNWYERRYRYFHTSVVCFDEVAVGLLKSDLGSEMARSLWCVTLHHRDIFHLIATYTTRPSHISMCNIKWWERPGDEAAGVEAQVTIDCTVEPL